jgi:signal transduction histidine kinase
MARPVPWVSSVVYAAVLGGGLYYAIVADQNEPPARVAGFVAALALLFLLDVVERRRYAAGTPPHAAAALIAVRLALFVPAVAFDGSGVSRALFLLVPFTAYFAFGRATSVALGVACVGLLLTGYALSVPGWYLRAEYVSDALMICIGLVLAISMAAVAVGEQKGRARLQTALNELTAYSAQVAELSAATERNRLARDIHDSLGHHLTAIAVQIEKASAFRDRDPVAAEQALADARWSARRALDEVRQSVRVLRDEGATFCLSAALADLVRHTEDDQLRVTLNVVGDQEDYELGTLTALYRAAQEGLTNARRHARATHVSVSVTFDEPGARLVVADDGRGFPAPAAGPGPEGFGLLSMRERVQLLDGRVEIDSRPDTGTVVTVTVPRT